MRTSFSTWFGTPHSKRPPSTAQDRALPALHCARQSFGSLPSHAKPVGFDAGATVGASSFAATITAGFAWSTTAHALPFQRRPSGHVGLSVGALAGASSGAR